MAWPWGGGWIGAEATAPSVGTPSLVERLLQQAMRLYPLHSGCGTIANARVTRALASARAANVWCGVAGYRALVPMDDLVGRAMYFFGDLDPKVTWAFRRFVRPGDLVLDVGANLGLASLQLLHLVGPTGHVHAFVPSPRMLGYLRATNVENPSAPLSIHPIALGAGDDILKLIVPGGNLGAASFVDIDQRPEAERLRVPVTTLAGFCEANGVRRVDFIKIDVEGFEAAVLQGAEKLLRRDPPRAIVLEDNGFAKTGTSHVFDMVRDWGFEVFALPKNLTRNRLEPLNPRRRPDRARLRGPPDAKPVR